MTEDTPHWIRRMELMNIVIEDQLTQTPNIRGKIR